jgi:iron complex transport system ATP-binding protein
MNDRPPFHQIVARDLSFSYSGRLAVDRVSFTAKAGEFIAIVGPNGCGKSTLLRLLIGELRPAAGQWNLDDIPAASLSRLACARHMSLVPQLAAAPFGYTVREMVLMARHAAHVHNSLMPLGFETPADLQLALECMWNADVHHLADRPVNQLSGGERQRVAIARAFTQNTPIMLLDEPTSSLDLFHQLELLHHLRRVTETESRLVLLVTHDLNLAAENAQRILLVDAGKIVADGTPSQVLTPENLEPVYRVKVTRTAAGTLHFSRTVA